MEVYRLLDLTKHRISKQFVSMATKTIQLYVVLFTYTTIVQAANRNTRLCYNVAETFGLFSNPSVCKLAVDCHVIILSNLYHVISVLICEG